jgi:ABC-type Fe3+-hydroxamate transport system substrate-binding protein
MVRQIQPDLIIANKEENDQRQVETMARDFPTWISDISDLESAFYMIKSIGTITGKENVAKKLIENIRKQFELITPPSTELKVAYLIWKKPFMAAGGDTFINSMLSAAGFKNVFAHLSRYPVINMDQIISSGCQFVFLSSEPYPFKEKHISLINEYMPDCKVLLVDGEIFSWYGSRLLKAPDYFNQLRKLIKDNN